MSTGDKIALISLVFTVITTVCVLFLAYAALAQTARPNIAIKLLAPERRVCHAATTQVFIFEIVNVGHWYASPIAVDVTVYCNFPPEFGPRELRFGSIQEHITTEVKAGKDGVHYLKAKGLKISRHEKGEELHAVAVTPGTPGAYRLRVTAFSANAADASTEFEISCVLSAPHAVTQGSAA